MQILNGGTLTFELKYLALLLSDLLFDRTDLFAVVGDNGLLLGRELTVDFGQPRASLL